MHVDDEFELIQRSPMLSAAYAESQTRTFARVQDLLSQSWKLSPAIRSDGFHCWPQLRIWDWYRGWQHERTSLTVYDHGDSRPAGERCFYLRKASWNSFESLKNILATVAATGICNAEPEIVVRDAQVSCGHVQEFRQRIASCLVPAISLYESNVVVTDTGVLSFEHFTDEDTTTRYTWGVDPPPDWKPLIEHVKALRHYLYQCLGEADG